MSTTRLLWALVRGCPVLPAPVHRVAADVAQRRGDTAAMARLVARLDAPRDVLARFAEVDDTDVQTSFLLRTGVPELQAPAPSRAALDKALFNGHARHGRLTITAALDLLRAAPDPDLARKVVRSCLPQWLAPQDAYLVLTQAQPLGTTLRYFTLEVLVQVVARCGAELGTKLLAEATCPSVVAALACLPVEHTALVAAMTRVAAAPLLEADLQALYTSLRVRQCTEPELAELEAALGVTDEDRVRFDPVHPPQVRRTWDRTPTVPPDRLTDADLARMGTVADTAVAARVVDAAIRGDDADAIGHLLCNPALAPADRARLLAHLRNHPVTVEVMIAAVDVLDPDDADLTAIMRDAAPFPLLERYGWDAFGGPEHAAEAIGRLWAARTAYNEEAIADAIAKARVPRQAWPHLPWSLVAFLVDRRPGASRDYARVPGLARWVAAQLEDLLEDAGSAAGAALAGIGEDFDGTFRDLLDACRAVAS